MHLNHIHVDAFQKFSYFKCLLEIFVKRLFEVAELKRKCQVSSVWLTSKNNFEWSGKRNPSLFCHLFWVTSNSSSSMFSNQFQIQFFKFFRDFCWPRHQHQSNEVFVVRSKCSKAFIKLLKICGYISQLLVNVIKHACPTITGLLDKIELYS